MERESFIFKKAWRDAISELPEKVRAEAYVAIIEYGITGEAPELKSMARVAFAFVKADIDRECAQEERQAAVSDEMRRRVMKRWNKKYVNTQVDTQVDTQVNTDVYTDVIHKFDDVYTDVNTQEMPVSPRACVVDNQDNIEDSDIDNNQKEEKESVGKKKTKAAPLPAEPKGTLSSTIDLRKENFYNSLVPFVGKYGRETIRAFFDYWSEYNKSRTKMRWELQKTWETARRLATWASRDNNFKFQNNGTGRTNNQADAEADAYEVMQRIKARGGTSQVV